MHGRLQREQSEFRPRRAQLSLLGLPVERLIGAVRLALAGLALIATSIDPVDSAFNGVVVRTILIVYLVYAALLVAVEGITSVGRRYQLTMHCLDIVVFTALLHFTDGPSSPDNFQGLGTVDGMRACSAGSFAPFNTKTAAYEDNVVSWPSVEPAADYTANSLLAFALGADQCSGLG